MYTVLGSTTEERRGVESIQRRTTKLVKRLEGMSCEESLRTPGLSSLEKKRQTEGLIALDNFLRRGSGKGGASLFSMKTDDRMHGNGTKLQQGRITLDIRKHFSSVRLIKHRNRLS